jgi:hypothetical protein
MKKGDNDSYQSGLLGDRMKHRLPNAQPSTQSVLNRFRMPRRAKKAVVDKEEVPGWSPDTSPMSSDPHKSFSVTKAIPCHGLRDIVKCSGPLTLLSGLRV